MTTPILDVSAMADPAATPAATASARQAVAQAATIVRDGGLVVFTTETFYGVAGDPRNAAAMSRLARLKSRSPQQPFALIAADVAACAAVAELRAQEQRLVAAFWPGPLTLLLSPTAPLSPHVLSCASAGLPPTLGVRVSDHRVAQALSANAGGLVTATSANCAGAPPAASCEALSPIICAGVDLILNGGHLSGGQPSTLIAVEGATCRLVRAGAIELSAIAGVLDGSVAAANLGA